MNIENALEGWVSPVELIYEEAKNSFLKQTDEYIMARCEAVLGVKVDRDELIKAMSYDREQYKDGFRNGYAKRDSEIVRCKECKFYEPFDNKNFLCGECLNVGYDSPTKTVPKDGFCYEAERKEQNE